MRNLPEKVRRELDAKAAAKARENRPKPTNADHIRGMSDEALAEWILTEVHKIIAQPIWCDSNCEDECEHERVCVMKWLQQPAQEEAEL